MGGLTIAAPLTRPQIGTPKRAPLRARARRQRRPYFAPTGLSRGVRAVTLIEIAVTPQVRALCRHRVVGYVRVSTEKQVEEGFGLDVQARAIRKWVRANRHRLVQIVVEEGVTGTIDDRPGLAEVLGILRDKEAVGVVFPRLDRLARDLIVQESLLAEIWRHGWEVWSATASEAHYLRDDPEDPSRTLIRQVLGAVSQYERAMIRLRLAAGRRRKADTGGYAYGAPPFGYQAAEGRLMPVAEEQAALRRMRRLRKEGLSLREIGDTLTREGVSPKRGERWHPTTIARALNRTR